MDDDFIIEEPSIPRYTAAPVGGPYPVFWDTVEIPTRGAYDDLGKGREVQHDQFICLSCPLPECDDKDPRCPLPPVMNHKRPSPTRDDHRAG